VNYKRLMISIHNQDHNGVSRMQACSAVPLPSCSI